MKNPPTQTEPRESQATETYRLVVGSAAEAVDILRDRFGSRGRVLSVRQVGGSGFGWFLQKPRLEVMVEVGPERKDPVPAPVDWPKPIAPKAPSPVEKPGAEETGLKVENLLRASGLEPVMVERIRDELGRDWSGCSKAEILRGASDFLRGQGRERPAAPLARNRVFLGSCGAGKTTALCKMLADDVFVQGRSAAVLKLDAGQPNASDGLAAYCEVLGVPLFRSPAETVELDNESILYLDLPGLVPGGQGDSEVRKILDRLEIDSRILVVNAAYDVDLITEAFSSGERLGATHVVYTHLDELRRWGKLWRFILHPGLEPLFFSTGPNLAGDLEDDPVNSLLNRTFDAHRPDGSETADRS
jgi:flagellar biosynthesis protein FlhF